MLFNSLDFAVFLIVVYTAYWTIGSKGRVAQNLLILIASYTFYGLWDWRFLFLLAGSSLIDFFLALAIGKSSSQRTRKRLLFQSIIWNIGVLVLFKYYDFFLRNFYLLTGTRYEVGTFQIFDVIIPLGLSFYTFQTLSYTIDVYRKKIEPSANLINFMCFVSFFPQLIAGPIERAKDLLPQFSRQRLFNGNQTTEGLRQILWGLFKKVLIADHLAEPVHVVFSNAENFGAITLVYATFLFAVQLYCDFSGYTDIAIGTARLFGFRLSQNFNLPYFSKSMTEFWQRWHITLTGWFTDYVFTPVLKGGRRISRRRQISALLITMTLIGLWHGSKWTFVIFGLLMGLILAFERLRIGGSKKPIYIKLRKLPGSLSVLYLSVMLCTPLVFFRSADFEVARTIVSRIFSLTDAGNFQYLLGKSTTVFILILIFAERYTQDKHFPIEKFEKHLNRVPRWTLYYGIVFLLIIYKSAGEEFIYFEF